jgi:hypothetical protein
MLMVSPVTSRCFSKLRNWLQVTKEKNSSHETDPTGTSRGFGAKNCTVARRSPAPRAPSRRNSSPVLNQESFSFAHQILDLDGEQGDEQHEEDEEDREAEDDRAGPGVAEERPHGEQGDDRDQESSVSPRAEITADRFLQSHQDSVTRLTSVVRALTSV